MTTFCRRWAWRTVQTVFPVVFPVGTKFVIEGNGGREGQVQVFSRYLEFPDGTFFPLPVRPAKREIAPAGRTRHGDRVTRGH